jgi:hypothetical protein
MARKEILIRIDASGRDNGKTFHLREMPAARIERWAIRALMVLTNAGIELPDDPAGGGLAEVAALGFEALQRVRADDVFPLLDEMMECVTICPDPNKPDVTRALMPDDDIEEVSTLYRLRREIYVLHTSFFQNGDLSKLVSQMSPTPTVSRVTRTSPVR